MNKRHVEDGSGWGGLAPQRGETNRMPYLERCAKAVEWVEKMQATSTVLIYTDNSRSWRVKWRPRTDGFESFSLANSWLAAVEAAQKETP